jgi:hypothetical protein
MKREEQIKKALKLLNPPLSEREECEERIKDALNIIEVEATGQDSHKDWVSKPTKKKLLSYQIGLERAQAAHDALPRRAKFVFRDIDFKKHIEACERLRNRPSGQPKRARPKQRLAATEAYSLLRHYDIKATTTRRGKWDSLAAILCGVSTTLSHYCCEVAKSRH